MIPTLLCSVLAALNGLKQPVQPDLFKLTLQGSGLQFTESTGFYEVKYGIAESNPKRSQTVYIRKSVETYRSLSVREVFALVWESPNPATSEFLLTQFQKRYALGGLVYEKPSETQKLHRFRYRFTVPVDCDAKRLKALLEVAAATGDVIERELNPNEEDKF